MKKLIIHIGYPKTATTSLQLNLFAGLKEEGNIEYLNHLNKHQEYIGNIKIRKLYEYLVGHKNIFDENESKLLFSKIDKEVSLISAETLSILFPEFSFALVEPGAINNAQKINNVFSKYFDTIEVIISIRAQSKIVQGCFKQWYHAIISEKSTFTDVGKWLSENFGEDKDENSLLFNYEIMYKSYVDVFGKDNVHILLFEDLKHDKENYYEKLASIFDVDIDLVKKYLEKNIQNRSIVLENGNVKTEKPTIGYLISRFRNLIKQHLSITYFNLLRKVYKRIVPNFIKGLQIGSESVIRTMSIEENNFIFNRFKESNNRLVKIADLDKIKMRKYGYL